MDISVPPVGESVTNGVLGTWLKEDGSSVSEGDDLFELETDKATLSVPAPASGVLHISVNENEEVEIGQVVGSIDTEAAAGTADDGTSSAGDTAKEAAAADVRDQAAGRPAEDGAKLSPAVRRIVEEKGLDPASLTGTGPGGRITKEDAMKAASPAAGGSAETAASTAATPSAAGPGAQPQERVKLSNLRKRIAANLVTSKQNSAHLTTFNEVDMSAVMALRKANQDAFEEKFGVRLGFMSFFVRASVAALGDYSEVNAYLEDDEVVYNRFYNIGVAVSTDRGLIVPVLRDADKKSFADIEGEIVSFGRRAQEKRLSPDELVGGTFTISNGGVFGSLLSTPIPSPPQTAVMGMHTIQNRPVAVDNHVVIRPMMYLALTYDHRLIDGREAVGFLGTVKRLIEDPARLMLGL